MDMFCVGLFVCLSGGQTNDSKRYNRILLRILARVVPGIENNPLALWDECNLEPRCIR